MTILRPPFSALLAIALLGVLPGCINLGDKPPKVLMSLSSDARVSAGQAKLTRDADAIAVALPALPAQLRTPRIAVQSGASFAYLPKTAWVDTPSHLFRGVLAETIEARTGRFVPDQRNAAITPDTRLGGTLAAFQLLGGQGRVLVIFDATISRSGADQVHARRFEATAPVGEEDARSVTAALNRAANAVASDVADWVGGS